MRFTAGSSSSTWSPGTADTTDRTFWLRWRVAVCGLWVLSCVVAAAYLIWRHEGPPVLHRHRHRSGGAGSDENEPRRRMRPNGVVYDDEAWRPCLRDIHPACLLAYRLVSFFVLFGFLIFLAISDRRHVFYYYTQWTLILVTIYFGLAMALSIYGCRKIAVWNAVVVATDTELGPYASHRAAAKPTTHEEDVVSTREIAGFWGYLFQIIYQTNAGAVMLSDCVFWFIIFPITFKDDSMNFVVIGMHSVNAVFLLGEASLNSLRFPWFRIAYFFLWTTLYIIFQWILHASTIIWWPYPFLDLSANLAPLWYFAVAFMQFPCYVIFRLMMNLKYNLLSKHFPDSTVERD